MFIFRANYFLKDVFSWKIEKKIFEKGLLFFQTLKNVPFYFFYDSFEFFSNVWKPEKNNNNHLTKMY